MASAILGSVASTVVGGALNRSGRKKSEEAAKMILPTNINTGRSNYNTKTGQFDIDPRILAGQTRFKKDIRKRRGMAMADNAETQAQLSGLRGDISGMRAEYEGNQSAYTEAMMNPLREQIARGEGQLTSGLQRRDIAGSSFGNQQLTNFTTDSGRALTDQRAVIENQRINTLGDFIGMDADIIKEGIRSRESRTRLMAELDAIIGGQFNTEMANEMDLLKLPSAFAGAGQAKAQMATNAAGVESEFLIKGAGDILSAVNSTITNQSDSALPDWGTQKFNATGR